MKKIIALLLLVGALVGCEKYEFGYIESLEGTVWQYNISSKYYYILDFKKSTLTWRIQDGDKVSTRTGLTWNCSNSGALNIYWSEYIGPGPYMTGTFDKYKGTLTVDGNKYKLISQ
jgi:hypothetical protein